MTRTELYNGISEVCPAFLGRAPLDQPLPYAVYTWSHENNFPADDTVYEKVADITLNLYAVDPDTEALMDARLSEMGLFWTSATSYELSDDAYLTIYTMEVIEDEEG